MNFVETAPSRFIQLETFSSVKVVLCKWEKLFSLIGAKQEVLSAFVLVCFLQFQSPTFLFKTLRGKLSGILVYFPLKDICISAAIQ